ncbi:MAG: radical SAM protein [Rhodobacteraceae bacterium]|nr:radical SAM protein [Paracoccaceae bacterium]
MLQVDTLRLPFSDPDQTLDCQPRADVGLRDLETLWFNTGTLCNIECVNCYIYSSPTNDSLVYLTPADITPILDEIPQLGYATREIAFTGGEPFMNPDMATMADLCLARGYKVLILTNAMQPMQRPRVKQALLRMRAAHGDRLHLRISIDHHSPRLHDEERGAGSFARTLDGLRWLVANGFALSLAGRTRWDDDMAALRAGYARLFAEQGIPLDAQNPADLVLFPEMDAAAPVPEITTACWDILGVAPAAMMCASSRMVVRNKGADHVSVLPCTLLPNDRGFEMGATLAGAAVADGGNFRAGRVKLNHPHCAKFCVLGGGSCTG